MWVHVHFWCVEITIQTSCCHHYLSLDLYTNSFGARMKKLQGDCVSWLVLLTGAAQLLLVYGVGSSLPGMFNSHCRPVSVMFHACMQDCTCLWDQPTSPLTTLRSSSPLLEMMLRVVFPLSPVTLTWPSAVGARLTTMVMEIWDSGRNLMGMWYWTIPCHRLMDIYCTLWGMLLEWSNWLVDGTWLLHLTPPFKLGPTAAPYQLYKTCPSVPTWVSGFAIFTLNSSTIPFQLCACLSLPWTMEWSHTATQHCVRTLWPPTPVTLATLSLEAARSGSVLLEGDGLGQLQLVKVSSVTITEGAFR